MGGVWKSISVRLNADVSNYVGKIGAAAAATKSLGNEFVSTATRVDSKARQVTAGAGKLLLGVGLAASLSLGLAAKATMGFDKAMSGVDAVTNTTVANLGRLRTAALDAGKATVFSASEAATATGELARAGVSVENILGGALRGSLDLAAAGQLELKDAATLTAQALNVFQLRGSQAGHVADVLAAGANKSAADVAQLGEALRMGGLVARQVGLSLEDTTGVLALFADNALIGSDAGTSLKTMLQRLAPQSKEAAAMMRHLGLDFFDAKGEFIGITGVAGVLQRQLSGLSDQQRLTALTTMFGADAIRGANILIDQGEAGVRKYIRAVDDQGAAQRMAAKQLDNLAGDLEQFRGSLETAFITGGSKATGALRSIVQGATSAVNGFLELPGAAQTAVGGIGVLTAAVGTLGGGFLLLAPRIKQAMDLYHSLAESAPRLAGALRLGAVGLGVLGAALIGGTFVLARYGAEKAKARALTDEFTQALKREQEGLEGESAKLLSSELAKRKVISSARELGVSMGTITSAVRGSNEAWSSLQKSERAALDQWNSGADAQKRALALSRLVDHVEALRKAYREGKIGAAELSAAERELGVKSDELGGAQAGAIGPTADLTAAIEAQKEAAKADAERIKDLGGKISTFLGAGPALDVIGKSASEGAAAALEERHRREADALQERHQAERDGASEAKRIAKEGGDEVNAEVGRALSRRQEIESRALSERQEAERKGASEQKGTLAAFAAQLEKQAGDAINWQRNLLIVARRFGPAAARAMADLGKEGAGKVAELATASEKEGKRVAAALALNAQAAIDEAGGALDRGFVLMGQLAATGGQKVADEFIAKLREGKVPLAQAVAELLAELTPLTAPGSAVRAPDGRIVTIRTAKPGQERVPGTNILLEAEGDFLPERHQATMAARGAIRVWNEPETGGESYIPHHPAKRSRSTEILARTAGLFGYRLSSFADGGVVSAGAGVGRVSVATPSLVFDYDRLAQAMAKAGAVGTRLTHQNNFGPIHGLTIDEILAEADRRARVDSLQGAGA